MKELPVDSIVQVILPVREEPVDTTIVPDEQEPVTTTISVRVGIYDRKTLSNQGEGATHDEKRVVHHPVTATAFKDCQTVSTCPHIAEAPSIATINDQAERIHHERAIIFS